MNELSSWDLALADWTDVLGSAYVITDRDRLDSAQTTTYATHHVVPAILRPSCREQVQECLRVANKYRVGVYPVSSGKNWGYGSRVPVDEVSVLLDLSRMNRILDFSEDLAYATVEPGVTQSQLSAFLRDQKSNLWMDAGGGAPESSLIGNTMERGFGHTPYGDHFAHSCGLEVILPTSERIETGFSRFPDTKTGPLYRWGVGPVLDGLFSQSNLGVVTRMSIWLMPAPEYFSRVFSFPAISIPCSARLSKPCGRSASMGRFKVECTSAAIIRYLMDFGSILGRRLRAELLFRRR
jgi:4-cresol dehydrogenase (hydroxylating)